MGKAAGKHHFVPTSWKKGKPLEDPCVGIIYKARSTLIFYCLYYSLIYSHLSYCTASWGRTYLTKLFTTATEKSTKDYNTMRLAKSLLEDPCSLD